MDYSLCGLLTVQWHTRNTAFKQTDVEGVLIHAWLLRTVNRILIKEIETTHDKHPHCLLSSYLNHMSTTFQEKEATTTATNTTCFQCLHKLTWGQQMIFNNTCYWTYTAEMDKSPIVHAQYHKNIMTKEHIFYILQGIWSPYINNLFCQYINEIV